jgi:hypothetical protein
MHGINNIDIRTRGRDFSERRTNALEPGTKTFPPMPGDEQHAPVRREARQMQLCGSANGGVGCKELADMQERVNHGVTRHDDPLVRNVLREQVLTCALGRREMHGRKRPGHFPVPFFGPRRKQVAGSQSRLDVSDWNALIKRSKAGGHCGRCISVHKHDIRAAILDDIAHAERDGRGDVVQILIGLHDVQVEVRPDLE